MSGFLFSVAIFFPSLSFSCDKSVKTPPFMPFERSIRCTRPVLMNEQRCPDTSDQAINGPDRSVQPPPNVNGRWELEKRWNHSEVCGKCDGPDTIGTVRCSVGFDAVAPPGCCVCPPLPTTSSNLFAKYNEEDFPLFSTHFLPIALALCHKPLCMPRFLHLSLHLC